MKTLALAMAASAMTITGVAATPALADPPRHAKAYGKKAKDSRIYNSRGQYVQPRRISRNDRVWRGDGGQYHCRRDNGTTGLVIGAGVGALAGREVAADRTLGAVVGAVAGGLLGREIDKGSISCR